MNAVFGWQKMGLEGEADEKTDIDIDEYRKSGTVPLGSSGKNKDTTPIKKWTDMGDM